VGARFPTGGGGSGGGQPPDLEELAAPQPGAPARILPAASASRPAASSVVALGLRRVARSGIYIVSQKRAGRGAAFRRGRRAHGAGLNYHLPWPIETVQTPEVTTSNQIDIGYKPPPIPRHDGDESSRSSSVEDVPQESLMLTGDENIVDVNFTVYWVIKDAAPICSTSKIPRRRSRRWAKARCAKSSARVRSSPSSRRIARWQPMCAS
jgi:membrane protease subunit HflK